MKIISSLFFLIILTINSVAASVLAISGKVTDANTGAPLAGASVSISELRISTSTDENGEYTFARIPARGRFLIEVRYVGYKTETQMVDLSTSANINFSLQPSIIEVHEVVVTGTLSSVDNRTNSTSVTSLNKEEMLSRPSTNIIDAISRVPGVSQITTGAASKPVIRGLSYNRVITLADGVKQEGQQWGDEHGIEIDQYQAQRVEILRGAASLVYGSDAMGGVINILDPLPAPSGQIRGEVISNYASNNGLSGNSAMIQGNNNGFVWLARGSYKNAYDYNTPGGRIANSAFNETNFSGQLGLNKSWGYTHLNLSSYQSKIGIPGHGHHHDEEEHEEEEEEHHEPEFFNGTTSRSLRLPYQDVRHYKLALNNHFLFSKGRLRSTLGYQNNERRELEESTTDPSLFFDLNTYNYDFKYYFEENTGWEPVIGISGSFQNSRNRAEEYLIPDYKSEDYGAFAYIRKSWTNTSANAGLRFDYRNFEGTELLEDGEQRFASFTNNFSNISGAVGLTHNFGETLNIKANIGSAFRAPNIAELSSNGVHEGTFRYEIGNPALNSERSFYADAALEYHTSRVDAHFNLYNNYIDNYIYQRQLAGETIDGVEGGLPVYRYVQDNANLYGLEAGLTLHPNTLIHLENSFSITRGKNRATGNHLPFMPAPVLRNELRIEPEIRSKTLSNSWMSVGIDNFFRQNQFDPEFETATSGYTLLNASVGTSVKLGAQALRLYITATNILDRQYVDHLNRLKPQGIFNQGRNVMVGLHLPFTLTK
ncbi:TonB-dependent receptor [Pedobacter sp. SYSU D00535]|uniref:TonB-dependent receptor n=1 Tax=Pedobacter sp. SYSU D00535 TaxID=2810308 RepID=UPI001A968621|nr:TonB-dependent receptor [Pedobacter sp. SYSU D00535]